LVERKISQEHPAVNWWWEQRLSSRKKKIAGPVGDENL
jgi:hypothetical protein